MGATCFASRVPCADARTKAIAIDDLAETFSYALPLDILRSVVRDYAARGAPVSCPDLRHCDDLRLGGVSIDLDGDGQAEWFVNDAGFTGTGAELDYVFQRGDDGRWKMISRIEGLHLRTIGPAKTGGWLDIDGWVAGVCVEGRGKAVWDGQQYVTRIGRVKHRPC